MDNSSCFVWLAPEPRDHKPRAPWFRCSLWLAALPDLVGPLPPAPQLSTFLTRRVPLGCPSPSHACQVAGHPAPNTTVPLLALAPRSVAPPPISPSSAFLFWTHLETTLWWQILTKIPSHSLPGDLGNQKPAYSGPRNCLQQFARSPVTWQFLRAPGC